MHGAVRFDACRRARIFVSRLRPALGFARLPFRKRYSLSIQTRSIRLRTRCPYLSWWPTRTESSRSLTISGVKTVVEEVLVHPSHDDVVALGVTFSANARRAQEITSRAAS